jgi:hypothetical protein
MVLFPFAFIWMIIVIIWVVRNETNKPDEERFWVRTTRWRPRRPRGPRRGPGGTAKRRASTRRPARADARESRPPRLPHS